MADNDRIFELRTYTAAPGKFAALEERFSRHTIGLFERHGMEVVAFFRPVGTNDKLVYLLAFPSTEAADASWETFLNDPEWHSVKTESELDGVLAAKIKAVRLAPTGYSPLR